MALTPEQIATKDFAVGLRGYDQDEVREYLHLVAAQLTDSAKELASAADPAADISGAAAEANAASIIQRAHDEATEIRQSATAEAEITRARARAVLSAAQQEALRLVAEAHARIDRRGGGAVTESPDGSATGSTIEQIGEQISAMVKARDDVLDQLQELQRRVESAVAVAEADPVLGRASVVAGG